MSVLSLFPVQSMGSTGSYQPDGVLVGCGFYHSRLLRRLL